MGVGGHVLATLHPVSIAQGAGWARGLVWMDSENVAATGIRSPDRPVRSESLHQLSYTGQRLPYLSLSCCTVHKRARYSTPTQLTLVNEQNTGLSLSATYADKDITSSSFCRAPGS